MNPINLWTPVGRRSAAKIEHSQEALKYRRLGFLVRIEAMLFELSAPFSVGTPQALDVDAAREASFDSCLDQLRSKKRERERQVDLAHGASFPLCQLYGVGSRSSYDFLKPTASARNGAQETSASFGALGPPIVSGFPVRQEDFAGSL